MKVADITRAEEDLDQKRHDFLKERQWEFSCSWPGGLWLYSKILPDGRMVSTNQTSAIFIEEAMETMQEAAIANEDGPEEQ